MARWQEWLQRPEKLWMRKLLFSIHLWVGVALGLYVVLMSFTGSMIVFRPQLDRIPALLGPVEWLVRLHENLLLGRDGRILNGVGAICVISLCITGAVIWWPGISKWRRGLSVSWRSASARFSWDLHSAVGFWTLFFVFLWSLSGLYFAFPEAFNALFRFVDPGNRFTDLTLFWLSRLHFGRFGWFAEAIWTVLGLAPALLSVTGVILSYRRVVR